MNNASWLRWIECDLERSAPPSETALPPDRFYCLLDDQPDHLVPEYSAGEARRHAVDGRVAINPACVFTRDGAAPGIPFADQFALQGDMVWIHDTGSGRVDPFWLRKETADELLKIRSGLAISRSSLSRGMLRTLVAAGVLVDPQDKHSRDKRFTDAAAAFQQRAFAPVHGLLHPFHISALRRYYRHQIRAGALKFGDSQSARRYVAHNESVARYFHSQLAPAVSTIAHQRVKPSYVYVASYQAGADLEKHTDREQCEFSISFCLDFSPEPQHQTSWPLLLHTPQGIVSVYQRVGDALVYRGMDVPHSRNRLSEGKTSTSIFFHYVPENFQGSLD